MPVYQMFPFVSSASPCGWVLAGRSNSRIWPVRGSSRPSLLANWPVHQTDPSAAACESCGRDPSVGALHSLMLTVAGPEISTALGATLRGYCGARYDEMVSRSGGGSFTMVAMRSCQPSLV